MRKLLAVMLLLLMMTCVAFAEEGTEPESTGAEKNLTESADTESFAKDGTAQEDTEGDTGEVTPANDPEVYDMKKVKMVLSKTSYYKTGSAIKPTPTLTYEGEAIGADAYTLYFTNNIKVGTATVTAVFKGGSKSLNFEIVPAKPGNTAITAVQSVRPSVLVTWNKVNCTAYTLQFSTSSNFSNPVGYCLTANSMNIGKLQNGRTYYFRVRPYNNEQGKTTYGNWSTYSSKVSTTGPVGDRYSINGELIKDRTIKIGKDYFYYNTSGVRSGCAKKMWNKVKNAKSKTKYLIAVDCTKNRTCIYQGKKGNWKLKYYWMCTTGAKNMPTVKGSFKVKKKVSHFGEPKGYTCWHATGFKGEYYFHSVLYKKNSKTKIKDGRLGMKLSHGCIRLAKKNAKWIYKRCKKGTKVIIY